MGPTAGVDSREWTLSPTGRVAMAALLREAPEFLEERRIGDGGTVGVEDASLA